MANGEQIIEKIAEAPSIALDDAVKKSKKFWAALGPGLTTGAADDDPSGIATYSQTGASYGFKFLWLAPFSFPLMATVQEICARIGIVTGKGLAANIRLHFPKWVLYLSTILLLAANVLNIGVDLGAMAKAVQLLFPSFNFIALLIALTALSLGLQIYLPYKKYAKYLKYLALILASYIFSAVAIHINWTGVLTKYTFVPSFSFNKSWIFILCAFLGTTISPYLFFWQTSQEVEEDAGIVINPKKEIKKMRLDVWSGMFFSNLVTFFIVAACAATLYSSGIFNITTAADAAQALRPFAGNFAYLLFALGIIGTGLLAVPVLAGSAAYAMSESLGWTEGLGKTLRQARAFYGIIIFSIVIGFFINITGIPVIQALIWSAVINGLIAPVILILIMILGSNKKLLGEHASGPVITTIGWIATIVMLVVGIATIASLV